MVDSEGAKPEVCLEERFSRRADLMYLGEVELEVGGDNWKDRGIYEMSETSDPDIGFKQLWLKNRLKKLEMIIVMNAGLTLSV